MRFLWCHEPKLWFYSLYTFIIQLHLFLLVLLLLLLFSQPFLPITVYVMYTQQPIFFSCILCVWWFDCLYVCESLPCLIPVEVRREDSSLCNWSDRRLWVNMWMLVTKPCFSGRPASALSHQAISPGLTNNFHTPEKIRGKEEAGSFRVCILLCRNLNHLWGIFL